MRRAAILFRTNKKKWVQASCGACHIAYPGRGAAGMQSTLARSPAALCLCLSPARPRLCAPPALAYCSRTLLPERERQRQRAREQERERERERSTTNHEGKEQILPYQSRDKQGTEDRDHDDVEESEEEDAYATINNTFSYYC
jgi:hypothetical protein